MFAMSLPVINVLIYLLFIIRPDANTRRILWTLCVSVKFSQVTHLIACHLFWFLFVVACTWIVYNMCAHSFSGSGSICAVPYGCGIPLMQCIERLHQHKIIQHHDHLSFRAIPVPMHQRTHRYNHNRLSIDVASPEHVIISRACVCVLGLLRDDDDDNARSRHNGENLERH